MSERDKIINKIVNLANAKYPDSEIYLYGSRARGKASRASDWDLLVLLNSPNIPFNVETKIMDEFYELELETGAIISPLIYTKTDWHKNYSTTPLFDNIRKEGVRIK